MKKVSKLLHEYQNTHQFTYAQAAEHLNLSKSSLYAYIKEKRNPTLKSLSKIATSLNVNISALIDTSHIEEKEIKLLIQLEQEPLVQEWLLEDPKEKIQKIKERFLQKNN